MATDTQAAAQTARAGRATQTARDRYRPHPAFDLSPAAERVFLVFLALCGFHLLWFSGVKLLGFDEMLSLYTEQVRSVGALLAIQRTTPVSLDPPLYHLLGHWVLATGLPQPLAVRLPSLVGSWLMLATVYLFTRRLGGSAIAAVSVCGILAADCFHLVEARPYGILLGATGLAMLCWQSATRALPGSHRPRALFGLFCALALASSCHYFGILVAVPFLAVEGMRAWRRRRLDLPLAAVLLGSYVAVAAWLPFLKAAHQYKANYYTRVQLWDLFRAYTAPFDTALHIHAPAPDALLALAIMATVALGAWLGWRATRAAPPAASSRPDLHLNLDSLDQLDHLDLAPEWALVLLVALLPMAGVALAGLASGAFETRYVLGFSPGLAIGIATVLVCLLRSRVFAGLLVLGCVLMSAALFLRNTRENRRQAADLAACARQLSASPHSVLTNDDDFTRLHYYYDAKTPTLRHAVWIADMAREIEYTGTDNRDRTMLYLAHFTDLPIETYSDWIAQGQDFLLVENRATAPPNWLATQLRADQARIAPQTVDGSRLFFHVFLDAQSAPH